MGATCKVKKKMITVAIPPALARPANNNYTGLEGKLAWKAAQVHQIESGAQPIGMYRCTPMHPHRKLWVSSTGVFGPPLQEALGLLYRRYWASSTGGMCISMHVWVPPPQKAPMCVCMQIVYRVYMYVHTLVR